jgi:hypothetical protein
MIETKEVKGTILSISNKVSSKNVPFTRYKIINLEGQEITLFKWNYNLEPLNKFVKFEIEKTTKEGQDFYNIKAMELIKN